MTHPFLSRLPFEDSVWGGPARVTFPTEPVVPPQAAPLPGPTLPTPPLPTPPLPTPGIEIMDGGGGSTDDFQFAEVVLGVPNSPAEALELLGIDVFEVSSPMTFPGGGGTVRIINHPDGSVSYVRPEPVVTLGHDLWD